MVAWGQDGAASLLDTYGIPTAIEEARNQAHRLRENALMVIGRVEQKA